MFTPLAFQQPQLVTNGLVLYLDASDRTSYVSGSTIWRSLSGGITGSLLNGPTFNSGNGGSIVFDGTNDYVELGNVLNLGTNSMTLNFWVNLPTPTTGSTFLSKARAAGQDYRFSAGTSNTRLSAFIQGNSGGASTDVSPSGSTVLPANTWFMATYVYDRASSVKIYYNGVQETLAPSPTISQWDGLNFQSTNPFRIGTYTASDNTGILSLFKGSIALTQVYFKVLTPQEVLQNFNAQRQRFNI